MKSFIKSIKSRKFVIATVVVLSAIGFSVAAHAGYCPGGHAFWSYDYNGYPIHQHYAVDYYGNQIFTMWHR